MKEKTLVLLKECKLSIIILCCVAILPRFFQIGFIPSESMINTLPKYHCTFFWKYNPEYTNGDIVVFDSDHGYICKRIIGIGGDSISIDSGTVILNNKVLDEPYIIKETESYLEKTIIPEGYYFVMGDNRPNSLDSRDWGFLDGSLLVGKVYFSFNPVIVISVGALIGVIVYLGKKKKNTLI